MTLLDLQRALEARGVEEVRVLRVGPAWVLTTRRDCGDVWLAVRHSHLDAAWSGLLDALDRDVSLPSMAVDEMHPVTREEEL